MRARRKHHLHDHVEDEEAVDQVERRPGAAPCPRSRPAPPVISVRSVERSMSPGVTPREKAMKPETASATSMTRTHHQRDDAAATRPKTSRGTISRQPAC